MAVLRSFSYVPMASMGEIVGFGPSNHEAYVAAPDFLSGPYAPPKSSGAYDEFGWRTDVAGTAAVLTAHFGASVQRRSLTRDRYHVVMANGVCARDSYHDGEWLASHIGERIVVGLKKADGGEDRVSVNLMDDEPVSRDESDAVLISHFWMENYAHTLLETASRFWAMETFVNRIGGLPVVWDVSRPWQSEIAAMLGVQPVPLSGSRVRFKTLYVPSFFSQIGMSPQSIAWLRRKFDAPDAAGKKRIFVSRADAMERRIVNENDVLDVLKPMGFESVLLTGMSVAEQRDLFRDAECVVMPHGAGCANMIFAGTGTKIIEFVPKSYQHHMFWRIAKWSGHWYGRIVCEDGANKDMHVDLPALRRALDVAGL